MLKPLISVVRLFSKRDQIIASLLLFSMVIMGFLEVLGIAMVVPFMMLVANPDGIQKMHIISGIYQILGFSSAHWFLFFMGIVVLTILVLGNAFSAITFWLLARFSDSQEYKLSSRLFEKYLAQPYSFFLKRSHSDISNNVLMEAMYLARTLINPALQMLSRAVVVFFIVVLLLFMDPVLAIMMILTLGFSFAGVYYVTRKLIQRYGKIEIDMNEKRYKVVNEAFGGIKDIKLLGAEKITKERYLPYIYRMTRARSTVLVISVLPRYLLESVAFGGIILVVLYLLGVKKDFTHIIPLLSLYAFAGYRLMPSLQAIFRDVVTLKSSIPRLNKIYDDLTVAIPADTQATSVIMPFQHQLSLRHVSFHYDDAKPLLNHLDLTIKAGTRIGLIGSTGSGKTTIIDIILGLLTPSGGEVWVDDQCITRENVCAWQRQLGYVPQQIYLADDSITHNIAFGIKRENVDIAAVEKAARIACIHDVILSLAEGYDTEVGERGVRLSGGQRQRLGIARALYRNPPILILDEATSALDTVTEDAVMRGINDLSHEKTIIIIAHRLSTVKECDVIYLLDRGKIVGHGSYEELMHSNEHFQKFAKK